MGCAILNVTHGATDGLFPAQIASDLLKDVEKLGRDVQIKVSQLYSDNSTNAQQRTAMDTLLPLTPIVPGPGTSKRF